MKIKPNYRLNIFCGSITKYGLQMTLFNVHTIFSTHFKIILLELYLTIVNNGFLNENFVRLVLETKNICLETKLCKRRLNFYSQKRFYIEHRRRAIFPSD